MCGWSTKLESPAHVLKNDVPTEIATLIHEDTHRMTHQETLREMTATPERRALYEGITELFTQQTLDLDTGKMFWGKANMWSVWVGMVRPVPRSPREWRLSRSAR